MNVGIISAGSGQNIVVGGGVGSLLADIDQLSVNHGEGGSLHQTVNEGGVGILINLLDPAGELVGGLGPVVILHRDHEYRFDVFSIGIEAAQRTQECERT